MLSIARAPIGLMRSPAAALASRGAVRGARQLRVAAMAAEPESPKAEKKGGEVVRGTSSRGGVPAPMFKDPYEDMLNLMDATLGDFLRHGPMGLAEMTRAPDWPMAPGMLQTRMRPFRGPTQLAHEEMDFLRPRRISCDVEETESEYLIKADLPGVNEDEIKVEVVRNNVLAIEVTRKAEEEEDKEEGEGEDKITVHRVERAQHFLRRELGLAHDVDTDKCDGFTLENGVLSITLKKTEEGRPKRLQAKKAEAKVEEAA